MHKHGIAHHHHDEVSTLEIEQDILAENNKIAMYNRGFLEGKEKLGHEPGKFSRLRKDDSAGSYDTTVKRKI